MSAVVSSRRWLSLVVTTGFLAGLIVLNASPAHAGVTGGCEGSADFSADSVGAYTPDNDTPDNAVIIPKDDGNIASWQGSVPGENKNFSGNVEIRIGPVWIEVADWGSPNHDGSNVNDERSDDGEYNMDELWDVLPKNIAQGIYEARGKHTASGVDCTAQFFVKFEGNAFESPIVIVTIVLLIVFLVLLLLAGRRSGGGGFFLGRPVLAVVAALFLALTIAILLQQFCVAPLDNTTTIILPLAMIVVGLLVAKTAPFGGAPLEIGRVSENLHATTVEDAADEIFSDGFESGDTSAWTDDD